MRSVVAHSLSSRGIKAEFKFSDARSLRLFVEGLQGLQAYERSARQESLAEAESKLTACLAQYPHDVLPQFYLGIVRIAQGYKGAPEAIRLFENLAESVKVLRAASWYNLASAYIELYTPESLQTAQEWLNKLVSDLGKSRGKSIENVTLRYQARILLLFYEIRQRLWVKREEPVDTLTEEITDTAPKLQGELAGFKQDLDNEKHLPDATRSDVLADYYNDQGLLYEFMAWTASDVKNKIVLANKAVGAFKEALQWKLNWIPAKSNLARVYMDLLQDYDLAIRCWQDVELVRPGDDYAEYMLGRLYEKKGDSASAEIHYKKRSPYCKR